MICVKSQARDAVNVSFEADQRGYLLVTFYSKMHMATEFEFLNISDDEWARRRGSLTRCFSFGLATVSLCRSSEEKSEQKQAENLCVTSRGQTFGERQWGSEAKQSDSLELLQECMTRYENEETGQIQQLFHSLLLCGDISSICQPGHTESCGDFNKWNVEIYV